MLTFKQKPQRSQKPLKRLSQVNHIIQCPRVSGANG